MKVWITGAERSLGKAIKEYFENHSKWVQNDAPISVLSVSRPEFDLTQGLLQLREKFTHLIKEEGIPDVFVHNAGITRIAPIESLTNADMVDTMQVNCIAPAVINSILVSRFKERFERTEIRRTMRIIHIASMGHRLALRNSLPYCMSKTAVVMMTKQMAKELTGRVEGISVFSVSPNGIQDTAMINQAIDSLVEQRGMTREEAVKYNCQSPMGRLCTMEEVSRTVHWLATNAPEYMTGSNIELLGALGF